MATNKLVTVEQLDRAVDGFAAEVKAADFEKKANLKALAYVDAPGSAHVSSSLSTILAAKMSKTDAQNLVAGEVGMAYRPGGSYAFADLPEPSASNYGVVYHITDDFTTDNRFAEGEGKNFSSGSEVGVVRKADIISLSDLRADLTSGNNNTIVRFISGEREEVGPIAAIDADPDSLSAGSIASVIYRYADSNASQAKPNIVMNVANNNLAIFLSNNTWLKDLRYVALDDGSSTENPDGSISVSPASNYEHVIVGTIAKTEPTPVYFYNVFSGFIDTSKFASQSSFNTFKAALDNLEIATSTDIQNLIDGLSLDPPPSVNINGAASNDGVVRLSVTLDNNHYDAESGLVISEPVPNSINVKVLFNGSVINAMDIPKTSENGYTYQWSELSAGEYSFEISPITSYKQKSFSSSGNTITYVYEYVA